MNGHHADCSCQSCAIGREIGADKAIDLLTRFRDAVWEQVQNDGDSADANDAVADLLCEVSAFLSEHAEHE